MSLLTDQILATGVSLNDLIHIVITGDTSQNPAGSSYKATISQVVATITGSTGTSGTSGSSGTSGTSGISGADGTSGTSGISGADGTSGTSGISGVDGTSGTSGISGADGTSGTSGISGADGTSGTSGISGSDGSNCLRWVYNNPSNSGEFGMNSNVYGSVTQITINIVDTNSVDVTNWLTGITIGDTLTITSLSLPSNFGIYQVTSIPIVILNVVVINVTPIMSNGSTTNNILNTICYVRNGVNGTNGSNGSSGTSGISGIDGSSGSSGTSGVSGIDGSSGTSGNIGIDGAVSARWEFITTYTPPAAPIVGPGQLYTDSTNIAAITEFFISVFGYNTVDYTVLLQKVAASNVFVTLTDITDNSILGSWDVTNVIDNGTNFQFVLNNTLAANGNLNTNSIYSISFSFGGANGTSGTSGITGSSGSSGTAGSNGSSGSSGSAGTSGTSPVSPFPFVYGLYSQTANSASVSATTVETSIIDGGVGTLTVPANGFSIGDSFNVTMGGLMTVKPGGDLLTLRIKTGSVVLSDTGPLSLSQVTNDVWQIMISFTVRSLGGPGSASIVTLGNLHVIKTASATPYSYAFNTLNNTTFDTTVSNTLDITVEWGSNNAANAMYSDVFLLNKVY